MSDVMPAASDVDNSVFLTTVQAVGTASRFPQIRQDAYFQLRDFQSSARQARSRGAAAAGIWRRLLTRRASRSSDLAFTVETAAELGSRRAAAATANGATPV